jgi:predicted Fe-S protein YdhL (DUF1289 family)
MQQIEIFQLQSPCRGICRVNARGYCLGCARSRDERFGWQSFNEAQKKEVLRLCQERFRRARLKHKKEALDNSNQLEPTAQLDFFD